jgi:hypothetical protein
MTREVTNVTSDMGTSLVMDWKDAPKVGHGPESPTKELATTTNTLNIKG